jgi:UDP-N-acetylglucosamine--dolichyl-phosphate N-acetylglucosaminephosphotransferase
MESRSVISGYRHQAFDLILRQAGQAIIISLSIILNDLLYVSIDFGKFGIWSLGFARGSRELVDRHLFSLYLMVPLVGVCLGLLKHNW